MAVARLHPALLLPNRIHRLYLHGTAGRDDAGQQASGDDDEGGRDAEPERYLQRLHVAPQLRRGRYQLLEYRQCSDSGRKAEDTGDEGQQETFGEPRS